MKKTVTTQEYQEALSSMHCTYTAMCREMLKKLQDIEAQGFDQDSDEFIEAWEELDFFVTNARACGVDVGIRTRDNGYVKEYVCYHKA